MKSDDDPTRSDGSGAPLHALLKADSNAVVGFAEALALPMLLTQAPGPGQPSVVLHANAALCRLSGYEPEALVGASPKLLYGAETDPVAARGFRIDMERSGVGFATLILYRRSGKPYEVFLLGGRLRGPGAAVMFASFAYRLSDPAYIAAAPPLG